MSLDPWHLGDRVPRQTDAHAALDVFDRHQGSTLRARQVLTDSRVAQGAVRGFTMKAAHGPLLSPIAELVGHREIAGHRAGQSKATVGRRGGAELWVS